MSVIGFDTSNYTTSVALYDGQTMLQEKKLPKAQLVQLDYLCYRLVALGFLLLRLSAPEPAPQEIEDIS